MTIVAVASGGFDVVCSVTSLPLRAACRCQPRSRRFPRRLSGQLSAWRPFPSRRWNPWSSRLARERYRSRMLVRSQSFLGNRNRSFDQRRGLRSAAPAHRRARPNCSGFLQHSDAVARASFAKCRANARRGCSASGKPALGAVQSSARLFRLVARSGLPGSRLLLVERPALVRTAARPCIIIAPIKSIDFGQIVEFDGNFRIVGAVAVLPPGSRVPARKCGSASS